ncbi:maestro heat-like repeat-containing protein family member 7 isoform X1 [Trachemys scripta elegans]|uniref:maestro heat-like repeat-containing protein family member 7 isoform X1 n=1 Tax=Trachemys scripta elegans TaxID=31138 RepID=UPI001553F88F|nr:maestro heat-like repeat-containing protein family member 7 isoform X1 [Trachemys scripta elegans]
MKSPFDCWGQSLERGATCPKSHRSIGNQQCPVWPESHTLLCLLWVSQELIEELPDNSPPGAFLANSLIAVGNLSTMTPAVEPELETHLLRAALHAVFTLAMEKDTAQVQDLPRVLPDLLDAMLGNLLADSPDTERLQYILEHINYWIVSRVPRERARAVKSSTALLRFTITLPEFDNSAEFPRMGHHMAQLALSVSDPAKDISRQARDGVYRLYQLLLHQRDKEPSWEMAPARRVRLGPQPISLRLTPAGG